MGLGQDNIEKHSIFLGFSKYIRILIPALRWIILKNWFIDLS